MHIIHSIPDNLINFVLVTVFSLLIGLSQRKIHIIDRRDYKLFGTDRTFTFIGILGFIMYILRPDDALLFIAGGVILASFFVVYYIFHLKHDRDYGITSIIIGLITYCLGPLIELQPLWMFLIVVVTVLIFAELKESLEIFSEKMGKDELITLAKFLIITGVILPLVPDEPFIQGLNLTPYKIWLAVVVVSGISYASYLLKKFILKKSSIIISGLLGGLYSSTATTIILAKKARNEPALTNQYAAGIILATAMMYFRVTILILIFDINLFFYCWMYLLILILISLGSGFFILLYRKKYEPAPDTDTRTATNPLEFRVALIFTGLFILLSIITFFVLKQFGTTGLNLLSFMVGLVDIDPFLISLFQGKFDITMADVTRASMQAIISNNLVKMAYAMFFSSRHAYRYLFPGFLFIIIVNALFLIFL